MREMECLHCDYFCPIYEYADGSPYPENMPHYCRHNFSLVYIQGKVCKDFVKSPALVYTDRVIPDYCVNYQKKDKE